MTRVSEVRIFAGFSYCLDHSGCALDKSDFSAFHTFSATISWPAVVG